MKCEYPLSRKFDVALIDVDSLIHFDVALSRQGGWKNDRFWEQPVRAAVELKYYQLGDSARLKREAVDDDVAKLRRYLSERAPRPFLGIALVCVQSNILDSRPFYGENVIGPEVALPAGGVLQYVVTPSRLERFVA